MIYLSSDLHFLHNKDFIYKQRGFYDVHEMNETIISNFNKIITKDDDLYLLGDYMLGGSDSLDAGMALFNQIPGKIHIIWGNHDTDRRKAAISKASNVIEVCGYSTIIKYHFYLSHYPTVTTNFDDDKSLKQRVLSISGHTHSKEKFDKITGSYNVALDAHNMNPISIEQILIDFYNKDKTC